MDAMDEESRKQVEEHNSLMYAWNKLGEVVAYQRKHNIEPLHPPVSISTIVGTLIAEGCMPPIELDGPLRDLTLMVTAFRWGQVAARQNVWYENLVPCNCDKVSKEEIDEIETFLKGQGPDKS